MGTSEPTKIVSSRVGGVRADLPCSSILSKCRRVEDSVGKVRGDTCLSNCGFSSALNTLCKGAAMQRMLATLPTYCCQREGSDWQMDDASDPCTAVSRCPGRGDKVITYPADETIPSASQAPHCGLRREIVYDRLACTLVRCICKTQHLHRCLQNA